MSDVIKTVFDHIPKTGGTSIRAAIESALGEQNAISNISNPHHIVVASAGSRRVICGHLWFYFGEPLVSGWFYATLLRDPLDRLLSLYYFHRQYRQQVLEGSMTDPVVIAAVLQEDLDSFLSDQRVDITPIYSNFQATHFATRMCERPDELSEAQLLDAAIASLKEYDLIGVYADIAMFLDMYCDAIGAPRQKLPKLNITHGRRYINEISQSARYKLLTANSVDLALVDWARHEQSRRPPSMQRAATPGVANFGTREIEIRAVEFGETDRTRDVFLYAERVRIQLHCRSHIREDHFTVGIVLYSDTGREMLAVESGALQVVPANSDFVVRIEFDACFPCGGYQVVLALAGGIGHLHRCLHWVSGAKRFLVEPGLTSEGDPGAEVTFAIEGVFYDAHSDDPARHAPASPLIRRG